MTVKELIDELSQYSYSYKVEVYSHDLSAKRGDFVSVKVQEVDKDHENEVVYIQIGKM